MTSVASRSPPAGLVPASPHQERGGAASTHVACQSPAASAKAVDFENSVRGSLKVFGLRVGAVTRRAFEARALELVADDHSLLAITEPMLRARRALIEEFDRLDRLCQQLARRDRTGVDAPERFSRSRDVGAHFGLTPRRYSSGQTDFDGRISRCGDEMVRTALYQAANVLLHHSRWSSLRSWAMRSRKEPV